MKKSNGQKKLDVIVTWFYPVAAGIETNILETHSIMANKGWNITVHTSKNTLTKKDSLPDKDYIRGLNIKRYDYKWYSYLPKLGVEKNKVVALHNFNIVPHALLMTYTVFLKLLKRKKFKLVLTPHGGYNPPWNIFPPMLSFIKRIYHQTLGLYLINNSVDVVRAVSDWEKQEMIKSGIKPGLIQVISNGIENEAYENVDRLASREIKEKVKSFGRYLIQIGRIYPIKNYETVIRTLPYIPKDVKYVIAGPIQENDTYINKLKKLAHDLKVANRLIFIGVIRGIDKYYLIKHAQMMVHMAFWESFCNVVHEGMSQGLVCIVANNTALPLLIKDGINGYCVKTYDSDNVANKINFVLDNKNSKIINNMQNLNKRLGLETSWEMIAEKLDKLYSQIL